MARLDLEVNASGAKRGTDVAKKGLDGVKQEAVKAEAAIKRVGTTAPPALNKVAIAAKKVDTATKSAGSNVVKFSTAAATAGFKSTAFGRQVQNVSFQVGDFATQVGAGTSASVALGQQLPQLLGGFGVLGAAMGAVVAIGVPLARVLYNMGDAAIDAEEAFNELSSAIGGIQSDIRVTTELQNRYVAAVISGQGEVAEAIGREVVARKGLLQVRRIEAELALKSARTAYEQTQERIDAVNEEIRLKEQAVRGASGGENNLTTGDEVRLQIVQGIIDKNEELFLEYRKQGIELDLQESLIDQIDQALRGAESSADGVSGGVAGISDSLGNAVLKAEQLRDTLFEATQRQLLTEDLVGGGRGGDPRKFTSPGRSFVPKEDLPTAKRSGGGGGGVNKEAQELERLKKAYESLAGSLDPAVRAQQQLAQGQQTINDALSKGIISTQAASEAMASLEQRYQESTDSMAGAAATIRENIAQNLDPGSQFQGFAQGLQGVFQQFFFNPMEVGFDGLALSFGRMLSNLASQALSSYVLQFLTGGAGGGSAGGLLGGLFKDSGGFVAHGQDAIVGEKRNEFVNGQLVTQPTAIKGPANVTSGANTARQSGGGSTSNNMYFMEMPRSLAAELKDASAKDALAKVMREIQPA